MNYLEVKRQMATNSSIYVWTCQRTNNTRNILGCICHHSNTIIVSHWSPENSTVLPSLSKFFIFLVFSISIKFRFIIQIASLELFLRLGFESTYYPLFKNFRLQTILFHNSLQDRTSQIRLDVLRYKIAKEKTGFPQGSVVTATLFSIAMEDICAQPPKGVNILVFFPC